MGKTTGIEWTDATWNPTTGCDKVSPGCTHCYALTMAKRLKAMGNPKYQRNGAALTSGPGFGLTLHPDTLTKPFGWLKPRRVFVSSMSDLFHEEVPDDFLHQVFAVMALTPQHTYQILTKRPERMLEYLTTEGDGEYKEPDVGWLPGSYAQHGIQHAGDSFTGVSPTFKFTTGHLDDMPWPLENCWLGVSVENQRWADERLPILARVPANVRFVSVEPLLGPLDLRPYFFKCSGCVPTPENPICDCKGLAIHQVIVGGESGPGARPMHLDWARSLRDQCQKAGIPFFFKQWGEWKPVHEARFYDITSCVSYERDGKKAPGVLLDGREHREFPDGARSRERRLAHEAAHDRGHLT